MRTNKLTSLIILLLLSITINRNVKAQNVTIETTSLAIVDKRLEINYDFIKARKNHRFEVWVDINNSKGDKINARTLSGDIGTNLPGGKGKRIIWDYNADGLVLDEDVEVFVVAKQSKVTGTVSTGKCAFLSLVMPGMGISSIEKNKPYWLIGIIGYASLGTSIYLRSSSQSNYDDYLKTMDIDESKSYYNKSKSQRNTSNILMYTAIGTWSVSMILTLIKAKQHNNSLANIKKDDRFDLFTKIDPISKKPLMGFNYRF